MVAFVEPRAVEIGQGITLSVHEQGEGPAVVFCHGFPELAFSWRYQLPAVAESGFRAIAPDQRGYGRSSVPKRVEDYGLGSLCGDLARLLDALGIEKATFVGHDWGGFVAWGMPVLHPDRCAGVVGVCTPYFPFPSIDAVLQMMGGDDLKYYVAWFQRRDEPERVMDAKVATIFDRLMRVTGNPAEALARRTSADGTLDFNPFRNIESLEPTTPLLVTRAELDYYVDAFTRTGFFGGISWYRNIEANRVTHPEVGVRELTLPCLQIGAEWDVALPPALAEPMRKLCSDLEMHVVPRAGHWVQQEYPIQLNTLLIDWLQRRCNP